MNILTWFCDLFSFKRDEEPLVQKQPVDFQLFIYHPYDPLWDDEIDCRVGVEQDNKVFYYNEDGLDDNGLM